MYVILTNTRVTGSWGPFCVHFSQYRHKDGWILLIGCAGKAKAVMISRGRGFTEWAKRSAVQLVCHRHGAEVLGSEMGTFWLRGGTCSATFVVQEKGRQASTLGLFSL